MTTIKINEQIAFLRKQKGLTPEELANALGVTNQAVSKWESAQCCPDIQLLPDLAKIFDVSIDELIGYKSTEGLGDICLKIKEYFSALPEKKAFENAYRIAALLHEIASTDGYKKTVPWKEKDYAADHVSSWGLSICSEPEGCTGRKNNSIFFSLGEGYIAPKEPIYAGNVCCFCANSFNLSTHTFSSTSLKQANVMCGLVFHSRYLVLSFSSAILSS